MKGKFGLFQCAGLLRCPALDNTAVGARFRKNTSRHDGDIQKSSRNALPLKMLKSTVMRIQAGEGC